VSPYIELHAASAFSFLQGASLPETLVARAASLGYPAMALLDRDGVYGAPRFHKAALAAGIRPIIGAELTIGAGEPDRSGGKRLRPGRAEDMEIRGEAGQTFLLPVLCESAEGYRNLCQLVTSMKLRSPKGEGALTFADLDGGTGGLMALVGRAALDVSQFGVGGLLDRVIGLFGRDHVSVEVQRHFRRDEEAGNQSLMTMASAFRVPVVATGGVRFATPAERPLFDVFTCLRHHTTLSAAGRRLAPNAERYLRPPEEMAALFADYPTAIVGTRELADRLQYTMADLGYRFPDYPVPPGETQASFLRRLTEVGARDRYRPFHDRARAQIARELDLIEKLDLAGYFLIVWDIVNFCRQHDILVQGRGSAANSAVCYSLGITAVDPVGMDLLFERFLSEERGEWPDIDLDLPSGDRRERVIQHVYEKYGRHGAAMTANVITYRGKSAAREVGRVLEFEPAEIDRLAKVIGHFEFTDAGDSLPRHLAAVGLDPESDRVRLFARLWNGMQDLPRHLGQHSGGMVICQGQLDAVVPLENASMPGRVVVQWDKDDCADMGIVKVDLLGLGMMAALQDTLALVNGSPLERSSRHLEASAPGTIDLASLPPDDPAVYRLLCEADTVGVFQVESRAQMATLPRLKPATFYDLVVQVAIIRPGPIVGQMVHPYLNRRAGREEVRYPHPSLEPILKRTLGVPLFQEQLLRIAMVAAGFTGGQAEELRRALGFKRSEQRMAGIVVHLRDGMARRGITGAAADEIITSIRSFALYGFPESHAASFALLAYASAWFKVHYPAAFVTALLNNQPMGFYHPSTLVKDAQRRGVRFHPVDVQASDWDCTVEADGAVRLGLRYVNGLREEVGRALAAVRVRSAPLRQTPGFSSLDDLAARTGLRRDEMATLADIGALNAFGGDRRSALWQAEQAVRAAGALYEVRAEAESPPSPLFPMTDIERLVADYAGTGLTLGRHPMSFCRDDLALRGVLRALDLRTAREGRRVRVAGMVITRQRPGTAKGFLFLTLEDETGVANVIVRPDLFARDRLILVQAPFLLVDGILQNQEGVTSVRAEAVQAMPGPLTAVDAHDFH
jgi:error-prone DNA polymerase